MKNVKKVTQLASLSDVLVKAQSFALVSFEKTTHITLEGLRKELRKAGASLKVVKNSILVKTVNHLSAKKEYADLRKVQKSVKSLRGGTALLSLGKDWSQPLNAFAKFAKDNKTVSFKLGFLDNTAYDEGNMQKIASLPSRNELLAKIIGSMKSPTSRVVRGFQFPLQKFVMVLKAKAAKG